MKTKIILEIGYNHNGIFENAIKLIDEAKKLDVWAVKFQKWDIESFPENIKKKIRNKPEVDYGLTYYEHRKFLEFDIEQILKLKEYAESIGLSFVCSGKDLNSLKLLVENNFEYIKIPSQRYHDNNIFKYLFYEREKRRFCIMASTGMLNGNMILRSRWKDSDGADVLFHCISQYPARLDQCNIEWMRTSGIYNGYSSHEVEGRAIKYAVCLGAKVIERHFTLDKNDKGTDHKISSDPKEMKRIIKDIKEMELLLGDGKRNITQEEFTLGEYFRSF